MSNRKYFGTDGIRGRVGDAPITPDFVLKLGWAAGKVLARHGSRKIIIGKDTRISGYMLESALEAGLAITNSQSSPRLTSIESEMPSSHLILCHPLLLLLPSPPRISLFQ